MSTQCDEREQRSRSATEADSASEGPAQTKTQVETGSDGCPSPAQKGLSSLESHRVELDVPERVSEFETSSDAVGQPAPLERLRARVERKAMLVGVLAFAWALFARADPWAAFVLTVTGAVAIVCFRGLAAQVRGLADATGSGLRFGLLRVATLIVALLLVSRLGLSSPIAFVMGLGILPLALMIEAVHQLLESDL